MKLEVRTHTGTCGEHVRIRLELNMSIKRPENHAALERFTWLPNL